MTDYLFHYLAFFLDGMAVNLTPGVYPLMAVAAWSIGPLTGQLGRPGGGSFGRALAYLPGTAVMYCSLGGYAAFTGTPFGGILQSKPVVLAAAFFMFGLAFSRLGLFQARFSPDLLQKLERLRGTRFFRSFFSGMFAGIMAAPYIGQPALALLASVADKGNIILGALSFLIFSIGLGLPGFVLAMGLVFVKTFMKPGKGFSRFGPLFGVILLGFSFYYFAVALRPGLASWILPVFLILGGTYFGFMERSGRGSIFSSIMKRVVGGAVVVSGAALAVSLVFPGRGLVWDEYKLYKLALARQRQQPVVIDFYADWCVTCHELEKSVFSDPAVIEELGRFVRLRVDATDMMAPAVQEVLQRYDVLGLPAVVFLDLDGQEIEAARVTGYVPPAEFLRSVQLALDRARAIASSSSGLRIR